MTTRQVQFSNLPPKFQLIASKRQQLRLQGNFAQADKLKGQLLRGGITVQDVGDDTHYFISSPESRQIDSSILLFGSGETAAVSVKAHTQLFERMGKSTINIAILSTPAGFQPNVKIVYQEIADFFTHSLKNFHPHVDLVFANNRDQANNEQILEPLANADYIFTGPGSPTYASKILAGSKALVLIHHQMHNRTSLGLASAAAIAFSQFCLPVYEIYKVGEPLHWLEGLNYFAHYFKPLTIVPHFNNTEGGKKLDTSHCYMGAARFKQLQQLIPSPTTMWGIDEHTAVWIYPSTGELISYGLGKFHLVTNNPGHQAGSILQTT